MNGYDYCVKHLYQVMVKQEMVYCREFVKNHARICMFYGI